MAGGRREVAVAAMGVLVTVLQANSGSERLERAMWKRVLRAVGVGAEAAASPQCMVPLQARLELVTSISHLHVSPPGLLLKVISSLISKLTNIPMLLKTQGCGCPLPYTCSRQGLPAETLSIQA